jgi:acyl-CoA dehydrogenase
MNFDFSDDQKEFRAGVRRYLADKCPLSVVRRVLDGEETHAAEVWKGLAELGCQGAAIPEAYGGLGLGPLENCVIAEELGRACAPVPFSSSIYLAAEAILRFGSEAQKQSWLPRLAKGDTIGTLAVAEGTTSDAKQKTSLANGQINGIKWPVADGEAADVAVVVAGSALALVDLKQAGIKRERVETIDPARKYARLTFTNARAEALGSPSAGRSQLAEIQDAAAVYLAFEQIGGAEAAMMMARDYALSRYAFGKPIGAQQAIKHKLADMYIATEIARSNAYYGAMMLASRGADLPVAAAAARVGATKAYINAAQECVQVHGGTGFTWAADPHFHYRRARLLAHAIGAPSVWKERLVAHLERRNATAAG